MPDDRYYRLYRFDHSGHIVGLKELNCRNDFEAIEQARKLADSEPQELWSRDKLLAVIHAQTAFGPTAKNDIQVR